MNALYLGAAIVAGALLVYLALALFKAEDL